eukprot:TRINITY_DN2098_c0_g1_i10.p4 TRINITY_DN2098_c0_g1~~TRINITY_DN2098_c0_g1_i10.p4  ORF type:complete len:110 (-),score=21.63 TRINITY_DN2098_c0_g1_i10:318-647(-)
MKLIWGSELFQYLEEEKSTETPQVVVSECGLAQTIWVIEWGCGALIWDRGDQENVLGRMVVVGDSFVFESQNDPRSTPSRAGYVESRLKLGGLSSKAKYSLVIDSELVL